MAAAHDPPPPAQAKEYEDAGRDPAFFMWGA